MIPYELFVLLLCKALVVAFNIDLKSSIVKSGVNNSTFGFAVLGFSKNNFQKGFIVGSPTSGLNGEIYWCTLDQTDCNFVNVDVSSLARMNPKTNGALFGYSLALINNTNERKIIVCAPRLTRTSVSLDYVTGGCFELDGELKNPAVNYATISICQDIPESERAIDLRHCTMGASVDHHSKAPNDLFMGGPYFYYAKGIGAVVNTNTFTRQQTSVSGILPNTLLGSSLDVSDSIFAPRDGSERPLYAAYGGPGVPVASSMSETVGTGMVVLYPHRDSSDRTNVTPVLRIDGSRFGSRFGHALILMDINNDGWEDLIVGAPYQQLEAMAGSQPEYGAVFVFINQQRRFPSPVSDLDGQSPFGYKPADAYQILTPSGPHHNCGSLSLSGYGATLAELGDINHDGYQDFAVGAPYAEGGGVVFIYHGSKSGRIGLPTQVICTSQLELQKPLNGLGFAVGLKNVDLDGNGYADLVVGAPLSDAVVVLRTRPIIKFRAHLILEGDTTLLPTDLDSLPDCTKEAATLPGYMASTVRCTNAKLLLTYASIDGYSCPQGQSFKASILLKSDPTFPWLAELINEDEINLTRKVVPDADGCGSSVSGKSIDSIKSRETVKKFAVAPVSFIGEKSVLEFGSKADAYFTVNKSANLAALDSPGGYFSVDVDAICRDTSSGGLESKPSSIELQRATSLRLVFRDTKLVDQTDSLKIGIRWIAKLPEPYPNVKDINQFPISDPKDNSQLIELPFDNECAQRVCCQRLRISYTADITRDKHGPVVYVGDDKAQTITVRARVTNIGTDPAFMLNLVSSFPSTLLEPDPSVLAGMSVSADVVICHLANPLLSGQTAECMLKWLVVGHQLTVQMAQFSVNSTVITGSSSPVVVDGSLINELRVNIKMMVNVSVEGIVEPSTVYFTGNVSDGISSMLAENQIGDSRLLIKFRVRNLRRHSLIPVSRLIVDWPYEISGDLSEPHGKYMLYLLENPSVVQHQLILPDEKSASTSSVVCDSRALKKLVNPHNYRVFRFLKPSTESVPVNVGPVDLPHGHPTSYPPLSSDMVTEDMPERLGDAKKDSMRKRTTISCYNGQLRCVPLVCDLGKLSYKAGPITIELMARLWDNTMREEFKNIFLTKLQISATWRADVKYEIDLGDADHAQTSVELSIFNNLEPKPMVPKYMILYIGLAVFGGVLLLSIIVIILKKTGFFKRKRFIRRMKRDTKDPNNPAPSPQARTTKARIVSPDKDPLNSPSGRDGQEVTASPEHSRFTDGRSHQGDNRNTSGFEPLEPVTAKPGLYQRRRQK